MSNECIECGNQVANNEAVCQNCLRMASLLPAIFPTRPNQYSMPFTELGDMGTNEELAIIITEMKNAIKTSLKVPNNMIGKTKCNIL
jgi:hypothetical protein